MEDYGGRCQSGVGEVGVCDAADGMEGEERGRETWWRLEEVGGGCGDEVMGLLDAQMRCERKVMVRVSNWSRERNGCCSMRQADGCDSVPG